MGPLTLADFIGLDTVLAIMYLFFPLLLLLPLERAAW
jgi:3-hydroxyacyl-CoA dehydrogenase